MQLDTAPLENLTKVLEEARLQCGIKGMSTAVLYKGKLIYAEGLGKRNDANDNFTAETLMPVASLTKAFTAAAIGELVAEGVMNWDTTPVSEYLPEFQLKDPVLTSQLTMVDLLSHRTGLPDVAFSWLKSPESRRNLIKRLRHVESKSKLGSKTLYNNTMYAVAGEAAANVAGISYEDLVTAKVIEPLGLGSTGFGPINMTKRSSNYAMPYDAASFDDARKGLFETGPLDDVYMADAPAGDAFSNVLDLVRWGRVIMKGGEVEGKQVLSKASVQELLSGYSFETRTARTPEFAPVVAYGLGWFIDSYKGNIVYRHTGSLPGFRSSLALFPDGDLVIASMANTNNAELVLQIPYYIADKLLRLRKTQNWLSDVAIKINKERYEAYAMARNGNYPERIKNRPATRVLSDFVGQYVHPVYGEVSVRLEGSEGEENEKLLFHMGSFENKLEHYHYDTFVVMLSAFVYKFGTVVSFLTDENGKVKGFGTEDSDDGQLMVFNRIEQKPLPQQ